MPQSTENAIFFPPFQQWLRDSTTILHYIYIACMLRNFSQQIEFI